MKTFITIALVILCVSTFAQHHASDLIIDYIISPHEYAQSNNLDNDKNFVCIGIKNIGYDTRNFNFKIKVSDTDISYGEAQKEIKVCGGYIFPKVSGKGNICKEDENFEVVISIEDLELMPRESKMVKVDIGDVNLYDRLCDYRMVDIKVEILPFYDDSASTMSSEEYLEMEGDVLSNNVGYLFMLD